MLNRKSQRLDLQEDRLTEQTVNVDAQGVRSEFGVEASAQGSKGMRMVDFNVELIGELCIPVRFRFFGTPRGSCSIFRLSCSACVPVMFQVS